VRSQKFVAAAAAARWHVRAGVDYDEIWFAEPVRQPLGGD
jgi:hypothetical protein